MGQMMGKWFKGLFLLAFGLGLSAGANAQCVGGGIQNCPAAFNPTSGDIAFTYQFNQVPHSRQMTLQQILTGAITAPVVGKITLQTSTAAGAGVNIGVGVSPTACKVGDIWMTSGGVFACPNGQAQGPLGVSASNVIVVATPAALPVVVAANNGLQAWVQSCPNGSESGAGATGCFYAVNDAGTWVAKPNPTNLPISIGSQALFPGGTVSVQGNGTSVQLANGSFVVGHALAYDNAGNAVDSGVPPGGGGAGSGTVTGALQNSIPFYSSSGTNTVVSGMTIVNNAVVATNGSGVPSEVTTLPTGLAIPSPAISNGNMTGTTLISTATYSGKHTHAVGSTGAAPDNFPPGVAPTSPFNGDFWATSVGLFGRVNGATQGPYVGNVAGTAPVVITGGTTASVTATCPTCATTTNGGLLTATAPLTISAGGLIALGFQPAPILFIADSTTVVHNDTYNLVEKWPFANAGTINKVTYHTGGTATPSFVISLQINGVNVTSCNTISVTSGTDTTATCTAAQTITNGQTLALVISGVSGSPSSAVVQVDVSKPAS